MLTLVSQIFTSWNQMSSWLSKLQGLQGAAESPACFSGAAEARRYKRDGSNTGTKQPVCPAAAGRHSARNGGAGSVMKQNPILALWAE